MTALVCFTMDNLGDAADLGRGVIREPRRPGQRPFLEVGFPAMLDLYARFGVRITHFVEGWNGEAHPAEIRQLLAAGHSLGMHGWQHENWAALKTEEAARLAARATAALEQAAGERPRAFRAPGGPRTEATTGILLDLGYEIDASLPPSGADGGPVSRLADGLWTVPYAWRMVDASHWLWKAASCAEVENDWKAALAEAAEQGHALTFVWHPHVMGIDPARREVGARILEFVTGHPEFEVLSLEQLVARSRNPFPPENGT